MLDDSSFTLYYPTDGVSQRIGKLWRRLRRLRSAMAFVAGSITTAVVSVTVEHFFR